METPDSKLFDIPGFENSYAINRDGNVYSHISKKFLKKHDDTYNYETVSLNSKTYKVHRLMGKTFLQNPNNLPIIDHIDRNTMNNHITNLRYVSVSDNNKNRNPSVKASADMMYIKVKKTTFKVNIKINSKNPTPIYRSFKTLDEAKAFRDTIVNGWNQIVNTPTAISQD